MKKMNKTAKPEIQKSDRAHSITDLEMKVMMEKERFSKSKMESFKPLHDYKVYKSGVFSSKMSSSPKK